MDIPACTACLYTGAFHVSNMWRRHTLEVMTAQQPCWKPSRVLRARRQSGDGGPRDSRDAPELRGHGHEPVSSRHWIPCFALPAELAAVWFDQLQEQSALHIVQPDVIFLVIRAGARASSTSPDAHARAGTAPNQAPSRACPETGGACRPRRWTTCTPSCATAWPCR